MIAATKKWIFLKISGAILVPLMAWFILSFISIYDQSYSEVLEFFTNPLSNVLPHLKFENKKTRSILK